MIIRGMNKFFGRHGRVAFIAILVVVVFTFVFYMSSTDVFSLLKTRGRGEKIGTVFGKSVSRTDYLRQIDHSIIVLCLSSPRFSPKNISRDRIKPNAIRRLVQLAAARERGIDVNGREVAEFLRSQPVFQKDGEFDIGTFNRYVESQLVPAGFSKSELDQAVREELIIQRLFDEVTGGVITTPEELRRAFDMTQEKFTIKIIRFNPGEKEKNIEPETEAVEAYFQTNRDKYTVAPEYRADLVRFNYVSYEESVLPLIDDSAISAYYQSNQAEFTTGEGENKKLRDLAEAKDEIKAKLITERCREMAMKDADSFAENVFNACEDAVDESRGKESELDIKIESFRKFATARELPVYETDWFSRNSQTIPRVGLEPKLTAAVADLFTDQPITEAIEGERAAFVALQTDVREERPAEFEEVEKQVNKDYLETRIRQLTRERAREKCMKLSELLEQGLSFADAATELKLEFESPESFTAMTPPPIPDSHVITKLAGETAAANLSQIQDTYNGALAVYVAAREKPNDVEYATQADSFAQQYRYRKTMATWQDYNRWVESNADLPIIR